MAHCDGKDSTRHSLLIDLSRKEAERGVGDRSDLETRGRVEPRSKSPRIRRRGTGRVNFNRRRGIPGIAESWTGSKSGGNGLQASAKRDEKRKAKMASMPRVERIRK